MEARRPETAARAARRHAPWRSKGTAGVVIAGRLLLPTGPITGELMINSAGKIACASASCSSTAGYSAATHLSCPGAVVSPGLINAHDHTDYNTAPPISVAMQRWTHRNGWRTGTNGEPKLKEPNTSDDPKVIAAAELRFLMSGVTSLVGSGGVGGFVRNLANYQAQTQLEGLTGKTVFFDTFPLGDSNGVELATGCGYPSIQRPRPTAFEDGNYAAHVAEGISPSAENEFTCEKATLITNRTAVIHGVGLNATDIADDRDGQSEPRVVTALEHRALRQHREHHRIQERGHHHRDGHRLARVGLDEHAARARSAPIRSNEKYMGGALSDAGPLERRDPQRRDCRGVRRTNR